MGAIRITHILNRQLLFASCLLFKTRIRKWYKPPQRKYDARSKEKDGSKMYPEPLPYWTCFITVDCLLFYLRAVTVPVWISSCNQCFYSSTLKTRCFGQRKANPRTSAWQSLQKFIASLCALFLNMGSNILWKPSIFKCRQWLFTHWPQMLHKCLGAVLVWRSWTELLVFEKWCPDAIGRGPLGRGSGESNSLTRSACFSVGFDPVWNKSMLQITVIWSWR